VLPESETGENVFWRLRRDHPAPFAAFIRRRESTVISASPERFFKISAGGGADMDAADRGLDILAAPVKGTQRRGTTPKEDAALREELLRSEKERAENMMIVDLLRNDLGRVSEYGSVIVDKLCSIEEHPTLFHLVSTVRGRLRRQTRFSEVLRAVFPCGSITGAPKISTMKILEEFETANRGLSMGAIGCYLPPAFGISDTIFDLNVAIRTMVVQGGEAIFNVGGGITIDSVPDKEYEESLLKAEALLKAIGA
jgi:para-aminobenzoate synthetase